MILTWPKNSVLADMTVDTDADPAIVAPSGATFKITGTQLYVPVVTLLKENDIKILEQLQSGFKRTIKWNEYRSQMTIHSNNNNLNHLRMLIDYLLCCFKELLEKIIQQKIIETFSDYYVPKVEIKGFNVLID